MALCHPIVQHMLFNIVSSDVYFDFPKFEENKDFSNISTKMDFFENFEKN